jgi:phytoene dehydrogenase-like protein
MPSALIIGAGPAGLSAGYELARLGVDATIVEADDQVGGLARTIDHCGYRFDIGGHRFFSKVPLINAMWPAFSDYGYLECKLAYRWWANGAMLPDSGGIALPRNLGPGESATTDARVEIPDRWVRLELEVMLVQVLDVRKGTFAGTSLRVPVNVE